MKSLRADLCKKKWLMFSNSNIHPTDYINGTKEVLLTKKNPANKRMDFHKQVNDSSVPSCVCLHTYRTSICVWTCVYLFSPLSCGLQPPVEAASPPSERGQDCCSLPCCSTCWLQIQNSSSQSHFNCHGSTVTSHIRPDLQNKTQLKTCCRRSWALSRGVLPC